MGEGAGLEVDPRRLKKHAAGLLAALVVTAGARAASADGEKEEEDRTVVVGAGAAGEIELAGGAFHAGANVFVEYEAIDGWLELELGASVLAVDGGTEVPIDLLVKKPFRLASWAELMLGLGPEIVHASGTDRDGTFGGLEIAADFMFWPSKHVGFSVEPSYDVVFRDGGASHGVGSTGGVIFGW